MRGSKVQVQEVSLAKYLWFPVHREGWIFVSIFAVIALVLFMIWQPLGWVGLILTFWCAYFFRNPDRVTPSRDGLIVSPADGLVQMIGRTIPPPELEMGEAPLQRISIFMSVFDVHVNRIPANGVIRRLAYRPGEFMNASLDKASSHNERMAIRMRIEDGRDIAFVQIAGLVARRIRCDLLEDQPVMAGQRFGLIRFGSRLDVYLPDGVEPLVAIGQRAIAGETVLADTHSTEAPRQGEVRQ
jgi:phosphatidylserine decarboxylase